MTRTMTEAELVAAGESLGRSLPPGAILWLEGDLGAGKTTMSRAIVRGLGVAEGASSPSYGLVHHYEGARGAVYHVDCYRLRHPDEAHDLDWGTLATADALLIEWPDRAGEWAPTPTHRVRLAHAPDPDLRTVDLR